MTPRVDVLIVGSGPSAAFAALACQDAGVTCEVMSHKPPSTDQAGAFFLHWLPERLEAPPSKVRVWGTGTREGYLKKQWGTGVDTPTSFPEAEREEMWYCSYALRQVWDTVPFRHCESVTDWEMEALAGAYRWVFHTFPSDQSKDGRKLALFPTLTRQQGDFRDQGPCMIIYSGDLVEAHVRTTLAWGRMSIEFPRGTPLLTLQKYNSAFRGPPELVMLRDIPPETAPVSRAEWVCGNVVPIGRFATWDRRLLSHQSYRAVLDTLQETQK